VVARHNRDTGGQLGHLLWQCTQKEEGDSAIPSSQRQGGMDCGLSLTGEEVVLGTSQEGVKVVECQLIRP